MIALRLLALLLFSVLPGLAQAADRAIIVFDASGSMWAQIDGKARIEIARETMTTVLRTVPATMELGLIVYGHREKGSCTDIELAVPPAAGSAQAIADFVNGVNPKGKTPLSASVKQAAEALRFTEEKATVILVTDGLETCDADPCALASELEKAGVDFTAHVVGFALTDEEGKQVACLAENTGGKYLQAKDAGQLEGALAEAVVVQPAPAPAPETPKELEFNVEAQALLSDAVPLGGDNHDVFWEFFALDASGKKAEKATEYNYGGALKFKLPAGRYLAHARLGRIEREMEIDAKAGEMTPVNMVFDAGRVTLIPVFVAGGPEAGDIAFVGGKFKDGEDTGYGKFKFYASAGPVEVFGRIGKAETTETFDLKAGEDVERPVAIAAGLIVTNAVYAEGGDKVDTHDLRVDIVAGKKDISGNRNGLAGSYGADQKLYVPAGDHVFIGKLGEVTAEMPVSVGAGERAEPVLVLNAGVLAISAPGARRIDILAGKKDISGNQKNLSGNYGDKHNAYLSPGEYEIRVEYDGDKAAKSAKATVKAGERTETTVE
ncbi:MAG: VWA domain-containing protein [Phyllobacteriaceae bacterium]|nr:VWA domain-containing protein [Phyllobacteriaceae bacterium]